MSATSVISNLNQALQCAGKCDCCNKLQEQINNLSQRLNNLDNKFVNKNEFQSYKQYIEDSFKGIRVGFDNVWRRLDALENQKASLQKVGFLDDRIDELQRQIDRWQNENQSGLDAHELRVRLERAELDISGLRFVINDHIRNTNGEGGDAQEVKRQLRELLEKLKVVEDIQRAVGKEARDARELSLRTQERMNALYNEWRAKEQSLGLLETRVKAVEVVSAENTAKIKILDFTTAALTKTTAFLSSKFAMQAAAIAGIVWTLGTIGFSIADLYRRIANINSGRDYAQDIEGIRDVASKAYIKADKANRDIEINNAKVSQLEQNTNFRFNKLEVEVRQTKDNIARLYDIINAFKADTERVFRELNEEIIYVVERARAAMERLEALIKSEIKFLTSSTLNALLRLQSRIERTESLINDAQSKANSAIEKANKAIKDAELAINDIKIIKPDIKTASDKAAKALDKAARAIELGDINNLQIIDLRIKLGAIPQQIKNEIIPTIPPIAEEYARKYAYKGPPIDLGEIKRGYNYSEDYKLDRLQRQLNERWNKTLKEIDMRSGGFFDRLDALQFATEKMSREFSRKADLEYFVSQYGEKYSPTKTAELERLRTQDYAELKFGISQLGAFRADVDKFIADKQNERIAYREEAKKVAIPEIDKKVSPLTSKQVDMEKDIADIKRRLQEREQVDKDVNEKLKIITPVLPELNAKLDSIIPTILGIPIIMGKIPDQTVGKIPNVVSPLIPTIPQIGNVVQDKVCNPQCQLPSISAGNNATNAVNQAKNDLGDKIDKANNAGQTAMLAEILRRMGDFIPGGLSGKMVNGFKWLQIDRVLNILNLAATIHNAFQLSSNIGVTLVQAMQNAIDFIGLKDDNKDPFNVSEAINSSITTAITTVIGAENYAQIKKEWAKYNRIYQAGANLFSSLMSMGDTMTQALQVVGGQTGRIGNALRAWGVVSDKAYSWMNPSPNFSNPLLTKLNSLEETASIVENVSQQPLSVKSAKEELEAASKELADSLEQKEGSKQGAEIPEAKKVKEEQDTIINESKGKDLTPPDLEPDEDE